MPAITSLGIGSGVDINSMVTQLVALESRPLVQLQSVAKSLNTQVSSYGTLSSLFSTLQSASTKLTSTSLWAQATASSSDETAVSVVGGASAAAGNYSVSVQAMAGAQTLASAAAFPAITELAGSGTLTLQLGSWDAGLTAFTAKPNTSAVTLDVTAADTLQTLRDKINALGAGVTASVVTDANGVRLSLRSTSTGAENGFQITAADADGNNVDAAGLSRFAFDPPGGTTSMQHLQAAKNAQATVNGIAVVSASNDLSTVVDGLTLRLRKENFGTVDVAVSSDRTGIKAAITAFADAYNALAKNIIDQTKYDPTSKVGGPLQGDSTAGGLQRQLRELLNAGSGASTVFARLSDVGLEMQRDGTLSVNAGKLDTATGNLTELKKAFSNSDPLVPANDGFARRYATLTSQVLGLDGSLTSRTDGLRKSLAKNSDDQARVSDRVARFQQRLVAQFTAMDANLARLNSLSSYVTQTLASLNNSNKN
jgi:flagellar hook-associated protein 2